MEELYFEEFDDKADFNFYKHGSSPGLLGKLLKFLDECNPQKIYVAFYLLNNKFLYGKLLNLAKNGVAVNIISIPLQGYDARKPRRLFDPASSTYTDDVYSKQSLAKEIYGHYLSGNYRNLDFMIFPHICVRSKFIKRFSRGTLPYSLHIKSMFVESEKCSYSVLSSSNFACRDLRKFDSLYIKKTGPGNPALLFFRELKKNSVKLEDFNQKQNYEYNYEINISAKNAVIAENSAYYSAPFFRNSNREIEEFISGKIKAAKDLIVICAQHLAAYHYDYKVNGQLINRNGILFDAVHNKRAKKVFLSQTYSDSAKKLQGIRKPVNSKQFRKFAAAIKADPNSAYSVNQNIHSKYIIADNDVFITSANFTPTQFIYLEDVRIGQFKFDSSISYEGIHSEVAHFEHTTNPSIKEALLRHCKFIHSHAGTFKVKKISS